MTPTEQIRRAQEVFDVEIEGLRRTRAALGDAFTRTVALMLACVEAGGKVVGATAEDVNGNTYTFTANKGVVLATGGFAALIGLAVSSAISNLPRST